MLVSGLWQVSDKTKSAAGSEFDSRLRHGLQFPWGQSFDLSYTWAQFTFLQLSRNHQLMIDFTHACHQY